MHDFAVHFEQNAVLLKGHKIHTRKYVRKLEPCFGEKRTKTALVFSAPDARVGKYKHTEHERIGDKLPKHKKQHPFFNIYIDGERFKTHKK